MKKSFLYIALATIVIQIAACGHGIENASKALQPTQKSTTSESIAKWDDFAWDNSNWN